MHSENGEPHSAIKTENIFQEAATPSLRSDLCNVSKEQIGRIKVITVTTSVNSGCWESINFKTNHSYFHISLPAWFLTVSFLLFLVSPLVQHFCTSQKQVKNTITSPFANDRLSTGLSFKPISFKQFSPTKAEVSWVWRLVVTDLVLLESLPAACLVSMPIA